MDIIQEWRVTVGRLKSLRDHYRQIAKQPSCFHYNTVARINCTAYSYTDFRRKTRIRTGLLVYFFFFFTLCTQRLSSSSEKERQTLINNDYFTHHQRRGTFCLSRTWSYVVKAYSRKVVRDILTTCLWYQLSIYTIACSSHWGNISSRDEDGLYMYLVHIPSGSYDPLKTRKACILCRQFCFMIFFIKSA